MDIGMIGLGRMGGNMAQRLLKHGHHVVGFDPAAGKTTRRSRRAGSRSVSTASSSMGCRRWLPAASTSPSASPTLHGFRAC